MRWRTPLAGVGGLIACALLSGCADFSVVAATPTPSPAGPSLPPIGFNHRYGSNPLAAKDGLAIERGLYAQSEFWEVAIRSDPPLAGYVNLASPAAVKAARSAVTSVEMVLATEDRRTIQGLLAFPDHAAQQAYVRSVLDQMRGLGYDSFSKAQLLVFFTESDEHAMLAWSSRDGYTYTVNDNDLHGSGLTPGSSITPLPAPTGP
jgi:hypothetical protein